MIHKILNFINNLYYKSSSERYIKYLRTKGILIGGVIILIPKQVLLILVDHL